MLIAGGVVGGVGVLARVWTSIAAARAGRDDVEPTSLQVLGAGSILYTPLVATGLGLTGGAMGRRGHADAHAEMFEQGSARWKRRAGLGWGLFAGGMAVWSGSWLVAGRCGSERCTFQTLEVGYYVSLAGTIPGIVLGSYASGFAHYGKRHRRVTDVSASPMIGRGLQGLSLSARF